MTTRQPHARWAWGTTCAVITAIAALILTTAILF